MIFILSVWLICCIGVIAMFSSIIKTQRENLYKSSMYIHRLKTVAKMSGCNLEDVYDDREM